MHKWGKGECDSLIRGPIGPSDPDRGGSIPIKSQGNRMPPPVRRSTQRTICHHLVGKCM
jgi:hypothetical protein